MARLSPEQKLVEIAAAPVKAMWAESEGHARGNFVDLTLPHGNSFIRNFLEAGDATMASAGELRVTEPKLRGHGIGARLTRSLGALAADHGYSTMHLWVTSEFSLDVCGRVFGDYRMKFGDFLGKYPPKVMPADYGQCREQLVRLGRREPDRENRGNGFHVYVDLQGLNMSGWERPVESVTASASAN